MVQRKVVVNSKLLGSLKLSSSSQQHHHHHHLQDNIIKNRGGADMKKKIKKSRSIKHTDVGFFTTSATATVPQVHIHNKKTTESKPNYMKATSSSDAKKENSQSQSQVNFRNPLPLTSFNGKKSCSKRFSISNNNSTSKAVSVDHRPSSRGSLKLVRTLTKTTNFKPARPKCSPLVLNPTLDFKRKTCSSTLKDSRFQGYLTLDNGGSEAQGPSALKVCPYTYCSLNGHHHHNHSFPPLKSFLSARRRMLKAQRSIKLGCLSPRRSNPNNEGPESASNNSMVKDNDFFIDIYSKENETMVDDTTDTNASQIGNQYDSDENGDMKGSQDSKEVNEEGYSNLLAAEESGDEDVIDDLESGNSDMDWEAGKYSTLYLDDDAENSVECESSVINEGSILMSDHGALTINGNPERIQTREFKKESLDEESVSSNGDFHEYFQGSGNQSYDKNQLLTGDESNRDIKKSNSEGSSTGNFSIIHLESNIERGKTQVKDASIQTEFDAFRDYCDNEFVEEDDEDKQTSHSHIDFQDMAAAQSWAEYEECNKNNVNFYQCDAHIVVNWINLQPSSGNPLPKKIDSDSETNCFKVNAAEAAVKVAPFTANITINIFLSLQDSSERNHKDAMTKDPETKIDFSGANTSEPPKEESKDLNITSTDSAVAEITMVAAAAAQEEELKKKVMDTSTTSSSGDQDDFKETKEGNMDGEQGKTCKNSNLKNKRKFSIEEEEESTEFHPREPNFLPLEEEQKPEKVDLRHQMMDDRRNTEEWMLDYALQQTLTKLAPAKKKKVALLVEAFEKVMPITRCDSQIRHPSVEFAESPRPIQACS